MKKSDYKKQRLKQQQRKAEAQYDPYSLLSKELLIGRLRAREKTINLLQPEITKLKRDQANRNSQINNLKIKNENLQSVIQELRWSTL